MMIIYKENIEKCNDEIAKLNNIINENKKKLNNNLKYKSILYLSGNSLSEQINKMLIQIFGLEDKFVDIYEEDFNFKFCDTTFVVETKGLFFVANERFKEPRERSKIKERQITMAKRNKTLIIETTTFYKIFEDFIKQELSVDNIYKMFKENVGLLEYEKITDEN